MAVPARELPAVTVALPQQLSGAPVLRVVSSLRPTSNALRPFAVLALASGLTSAVMVGFANLVSGWGQI
ncbi:hypothetical protein LBMAG15_03160 [Actinomycetes bacterium]|nr:hypothetical protein LBMAG15_03160 [Actinomycetes bacterium]